jgi:hypothetical protein
LSPFREGGILHLLALDIASKKTGWARWDTAQCRPVFGVFHAGDGKLGERAAAFRIWLNGKIVADGIGSLVIEAPVPMGGGQTSLDTLLALYGFYVIALEIAETRALSLSEINVGTWRKHFIGTARASMKKPDGSASSPSWRKTWIKNAVIAKCQERGWPATANDAADALGLLDYARSMGDAPYSLSTTPLFGEAA